MLGALQDLRSLGAEQGSASSAALLISPFSFAALEFSQAGKSLESKIYDTLQWQVTGGARPPLPWHIHGARLGGGVLDKGCRPPSPSRAFQVWSLLPGFCTHPTDVVGAFKGLARTLGMAISERPDLRPTVCQALRTLIHRGCETGRVGSGGVTGGSLSPAATR